MKYTKKVMISLRPTKTEVRVGLLGTLELDMLHTQHTSCI